MIQNPKDTEGYTMKNVPPYSSPQPPSSSPWRQPSGLISTILPKIRDACSYIYIDTHTHNICVYIYIYTLYDMYITCGNRAESGPSLAG